MTDKGKVVKAVNCIDSWAIGGIGDWSNELGDDFFILRNRAISRQLLTVLFCTLSWILYTSRKYIVGLIFAPLFLFAACIGLYGSIRAKAVPLSMCTGFINWQVTIFFVYQLLQWMIVNGEGDGEAIALSLPLLIVLYLTRSTSTLLAFMKLHQDVPGFWEVC